MRSRVTLGVGFPYLLGRVTLLGVPTFCHVNTRGRVTLLLGSTFVGSDYCQIAAKLGVFLFGDMTVRTLSTEKPQPKRQVQGKLNLPPKYFALQPFGFALSDHAVVSLSAKFNNRDSPRVKTSHLKGGLSFAPYRRVTLLRGSPYLHVNRP